MKRADCDSISKICGMNVLDVREEGDGGQNGDIAPFEPLGPIDWILGVVWSIPIHNVWVNRFDLFFRL